MYVLGIESSCDETSAAVVSKGNVLSCETLSSLKKHAEFGGIIPEIATREHARAIDTVVYAAIKRARISIKDVECVAVTQGPGLIGSLLVGISFAKAFAYARNLPLIGVDHLHAHMFGALLNRPSISFPFLGLVVSGGHTQVYLVKDIDNFELLGKTLDDAAGEALDKVGRFFGLGYPAAPDIDRMYNAENVDPQLFNIKDKTTYNVSFSGIKTKAVYLHNQFKKAGELDDVKINSILSSFQFRVMETIIEKIKMALKNYNVKSVVCGGGVIANSYLRKRLCELSQETNIEVIMPESQFCADNAAMIAGLGELMFKNGHKSDFSMKPFSRS